MADVREGPGDHDEITARRAQREQRRHSSHITTMPRTCSRDDSGLASTTAASQTVADPAASWSYPECYTPTHRAPRLGTDAPREPCRSTLGTERRRKRVPFTEAPMPKWMWSEGGDVPPAAPDCGACSPDPQSPAQGEGASDPAHRTKIDSRPVVPSLPGPSSPGTVPPRSLILEGQDQHPAKIKEARHGTPLQRL